MVCWYYLVPNSLTCNTYSAKSLLHSIRGYIRIVTSSKLHDHLQAVSVLMKGRANNTITKDRKCKLTCSPTVWGPGSVNVLRTAAGAMLYIARFTNTMTITELHWPKIAKFTNTTIITQLHRPKIKEGICISYSMIQLKREVHVSKILWCVVLPIVFSFV